MWVRKTEWLNTKKEIDELKKAHLSLEKNIRESIESNRILISVMQEVYKQLERSNSANTDFTERIT